ncbi:hypothetical protein [Parafrankia elaeagni]|uniref:hypothetical protein n=1 Tax=Parafrankia elaeagni TaxID=222534 RepID=UPI000366F645|nr:hypothetical protein [Parafrankia elaeagni]
MDGHRVDRAKFPTPGEDVGTSPPAPYPWPGAAAPAGGEAPATVRRYDPARFLQGLVTTAWRQAEERGQAVYIQGPWPAIAVYPSSFTAIVYGGEDGLRPYAGREDLPLQADLAFSRAPRYDVNHRDMVPLDGLLWKLALSASRGRLPLEVSLDAPCALREWPNFTRLIVTPGAMSIAALWARQPSTLSQTINVLNLPAEDVFAFYSAAAAVDLVRSELPSQPSPLVPSPPVPTTPSASQPPASPPTVAPTPRRRLLRKLFDRLRAD